MKRKTAFLFGKWITCDVLKEIKRFPQFATNQNANELELVWWKFSDKVTNRSENVLLASLGLIKVE